MRYIVGIALICMMSDIGYAWALPFSLRMSTLRYYDFNYEERFNLLNNTNHFYVILQNESNKKQALEYDTCDSSLMDHLSFEIKDTAKNVIPIVCGAGSIARKRGNIFTCKMFPRKYSLLPKESIGNFFPKLRLGGHSYQLTRFATRL